MQDVLADLLHGGDAVGFEIGSGLCCDLLGDIFGEGVEAVVLGDEIRLAVDLDEHADFGAGQDGLGDDAFLGFAICLLRGAGRAFFAQHIDGGFEVAIGLGERAFAFHQTGIGLFAEGFDELGVDDLGHGKS